MIQTLSFAFLTFSYAHSVVNDLWKDVINALKVQYGQISHKVTTQFTQLDSYGDCVSAIDASLLRESTGGDFNHKRLLSQWRERTDSRPAAD